MSVGECVSVCLCVQLPIESEIDLRVPKKMAVSSATLIDAPATDLTRRQANAIGSKSHIVSLFTITLFSPFVASTRTVRQAKRESRKKVGNIRNKNAGSFWITATDTVK